MGKKVWTADSWAHFAEEFSKKTALRVSSLPEATEAGMVRFLTSDNNWYCSEADGTGFKWTKYSAGGGTPKFVTVNAFSDLWGLSAGVYIARVATRFSVSTMSTASSGSSASFDVGTSHLVIKTSATQGTILTNIRLGQDLRTVDTSRRMSCYSFYNTTALATGVGYSSFVLSQDLSSYAQAIWFDYDGDTLDDFKLRCVIPVGDGALGRVTFRDAVTFDNGVSVPEGTTLLLSPCGADDYYVAGVAIAPDGTAYTIVGDPNGGSWSSMKDDQDASGVTVNAYKVGGSTYAGLNDSIIHRPASSSPVPAVPIPITPSTKNGIAVGSDNWYNSGKLSYGSSDFALKNGILSFSVDISASSEIVTTDASETYVRIQIGTEAMLTLLNSMLGTSFTQSQFAAVSSYFAPVCMKENVLQNGGPNGEWLFTAHLGSITAYITPSGSCLCDLYAYMYCFKELRNDGGITDQSMILVIDIDISRLLAALYGVS